ncbi:UDP-glucose 4-epimerase GalE [Streptomyces sp. B1866]|uniref:UDP-glucose 4-epimerase GalE n=1 Tax=Streptomyces sp. B1866 TaxID=3075431 RepID=UPI002891A33A|nr:UDP-glucose 4-epimerase GalE [Streptomyces sp. B1866]MDT3396018.1 UDP-glucose 4-epimerase GalE [Streptomyces sp. B1866]
MTSTVLVTGGAGFIGSHTCVELLSHGHEVVVVDDFSNSSPGAVEAVHKLAGRPVQLHRADLRDRAALAEVFRAHRFDAVIHFAAKKAVGESTRIPLTYFDINIGGTTALLHAMNEHGVRRLVFSSSCSVYGETSTVPLDEDSPAAPTNPYARSKYLCEQLLADACAYDPGLSVIALRYFNPIGAHPSGEIGEDPAGVPNNVLPYMAQVAVGRLPELPVYGDDYPTPDGTGVRDYIHVVDVADGHRVALDHLDDETGLRVFNLGTGTGASVLTLLAEFSRAAGRPIPYRVEPRRAGDVATLIADPRRVERAWGWRTTRDLAAMCEDAWRFQRLHPAGYAG